METLLSDQVRYITNNQEERVGVLLDLSLYQRLTRQNTTDPELLMGLEQAALLALADSVLAPAAHVRLNELLERNAEGQLSIEENTKLDTLLEQVDQLTLLRTRARYTLKHLEGISM